MLMDYSDHPGNAAGLWDTNDFETTLRDSMKLFHAGEADLAHDIDADLVIPCHYDMAFQNGEDPLHFAEYMRIYYPERKFPILSLGERVLFIPAAYIDETP